MGDASWADAGGFVGVVVSALWVVLALIVGVFVLAAIRIPGLAVWRRLERRYGPGMARWSRRRAGVGEGAGPWACPACKSVNPPTVVACYGCGGQRAGDAPELREAATNPDIFHRPPRPNEFDPSRYRGPGAPPPAPPGVPPPAPPATPPPPATLAPLATQEPSPRDVS